MPRKSKNTGSPIGTKPRRAKALEPQADVAQNAPLTGRVIERADGFYWQKAKGDSHGPYTTLAEAEADMLADGATEEVEAGESLQEAESELGISEWIDPDTGGPAEDNVPRIEDH
jgi:hypothetical protein